MPKKFVEQISVRICKGAFEIFSKGDAWSIPEGIYRDYFQKSLLKKLPEKLKKNTGGIL